MRTTSYPEPPRDRDSDDDTVADYARLADVADHVQSAMLPNLAEPVIVVNLGGNVGGILVATDSADPLIVTLNPDPDGPAWVASRDADPYTLGFGETASGALVGLRLYPVVTE